MTSPGSHQPVVLVVDDDEDAQLTIAHMLTVRGFQVLTAGDQAGAMAACQAHGAVDALVADLSLPGEVTGALARTINTAYPTIKIVYASGIPRHVALSGGLVLTNMPYVEKPVDPDMLAGLLRSLLGQNAR